MHNDQRLRRSIPEFIHGLCNDSTTRSQMQSPRAKNEEVPQNTAMHSGKKGDKLPDGNCFLGFYCMHNPQRDLERWYFEVSLHFWKPCFTGFTLVFKISHILSCVCMQMHTLARGEATLTDGHGGHPKRVHSQPRNTDPAGQARAEAGQVPHPGRPAGQVRAASRQGPGESRTRGVPAESSERLLPPPQARSACAAQEQVLSRPRASSSRQICPAL